MADCRFKEEGVKRRVFILIAGLLLSPVAYAHPVDCNGQYYKNEAPDILSVAKQSRTMDLCFSEYAVMYSGVVRTPLWAAAHLTRERVIRAWDVKRKGEFHEEELLPPRDRSRLSDYKGSGFDRGHMEPAADFATYKGQRESFSLANIVPQVPWNNRHIWAGIEAAVRDMALKGGDIYVITGPLFEGRRLKALKGRVYVPTHLFKAIYDAKKRAGAAYLIENARTTKYRVVSIAEMERISGYNLFPKLSAREKERMLRLPKPKLRGH